ncbi:hypothetical protein F4818DRAFT_445197 [Hypoxylon cercidicola]|nr:hypothetical protein F4818DRAFT_445197 [Hypoxylon cercidicola]
MENDKSLGFTVNAGPLSQVSVDVISLRTAIQLASGAYGWFKGGERSQSLTQLLKANGVELRSTSSFTHQNYIQLLEKHRAMRGVVLENGTMRTVEMPNASTAVSNIPGVTCLRALTCCLLCLCTTEATTAMLQRLIPYGLVQHEMEDGVLEVDGPLLSGLKQWVSTVATEEESNLFRNHLLECVDESLLALRQADLDNIMSASEYYNSGDEALILGVLKWAITPKHRRKEPKYPTRSLRVWIAASIMSQLGFEVRPSYEIINNNEAYQRMETAPDGIDTPDVFLVVSSRINCQTDREVEFVFAPEEVPLPRATLLVTVPWLAFQHVKYMHESLDAQYLREAYQYAFKCARELFRLLQVDNFSVNLKIKNSEKLITPFADRYKALFTPFSPHIHYICLQAMTHFGPNGAGPWTEWDFSDPETLFLSIRTQTPSQCMRNFYTTLAVVLGAMYGICSQACLDGGNPLGDDSEILFNPDSLYQSDCRLIRKWAASVGQALRGRLNYSEWNSMLFEMFLGATSRTTEAVGQQEYILGIQSHGFAAVSKVLVQRQIRPEALAYVYIGRGQLLNLPLDDQGLVRGSSFLPFATQIRLGNTDQKDLETLYRGPCNFPVEYTRMEVEPCWEKNPQAVILKMRQMGAPVASLNIGRILERRSRNIIKCSCHKYSNEASVPLAERWYRLHIDDLKSYTSGDLSSGKLADLQREKMNFLIDASKSEDALVYVLGIVDAQRIFIAEECLECAYKCCQGARSAVIVIPHDTKMVEDTKDQISKRERVITERKQKVEGRKAAFSARIGAQVANNP